MKVTFVIRRYCFMEPVMPKYVMAVVTNFGTSGYTPEEFGIVVPILGTPGYKL